MLDSRGIMNQIQKSVIQCSTCRTLNMCAQDPGTPELTAKELHSYV